MLKPFTAPTVSTESAWPFFVSRRLTVRRPWAAVALAAVLLGSLAYAPRAYAAPAVANVRFYMDVINPKLTVCTGESVTYTVNVYRQFTSPPPGWTSSTLPDPTEVPGVRIGGRARPLGSIPSRQLLNTTGFEPEHPNSVDILFHAGNEPGKTTVLFDATVSGYAGDAGYVSFPVPVTIIVCEYKVRSVSNWFIAQGTGGSIALVALIRDAKLTAQSETHYTGSANVRWIPLVVLPSACVHTDTVPPTKASLTGDLEENGELTVGLTFDTAALTEKGSCGPQKINTTNSITPEPVELIVPEAGGAGQGKQVLRGPLTAPGHITFVVTPVAK